MALNGVRKGMDCGVIENMGTNRDEWKQNVQG